MLVRDLMTIGVPICRDTETCAEVKARLEKQKSDADAIVALDEDGMSCGWLTRDRLDQDGAKLITDVMDEEIPTVSPTLPVEAAAQLMRNKGVQHLLLMHNWPGEPRPSAVISLKKIESVKTK